MKLYTRNGDKGETGLFGGRRVAKNHDQVAAYGEIDELNAVLGFAAAACDNADWLARLRQTQMELFEIGAELAADPAKGSRQRLEDNTIERLERWIDEADGQAPPLRNFILPGGTDLASRFHLARTVCRRAERSVVKASRGMTVSRVTLIYLNRLGDLLFAWARQANALAGTPDVIWPPQ